LTARSLPLVPLPQKKVSLPFDARLGTIVPGGISTCSSGSPLCGTIEWE
jgi:hypothetical protein